MDDLVARAKAALENVTREPWQQNGNNGIHTPQGRCIALTYSDDLWVGGSKSDAEFIVAARSLVPEVVAKLEAVQALAKRWDDYAEYDEDFAAVIAYGNCSEELRSVVGGEPSE